MNSIRTLGLSGLCVLCVAWCAAGCTVTLVEGEESSGEQPFTAAVWNLQALFDGEDNGIEYDEYRASAGWNNEKYTARILAIAEAAAKMNDSGAPDFIGLVEIENEGVLKDLAARIKGGYQSWYFGGVPGSSLGTGALSRYPITDARTHSLTQGDATTPRPVLELRIEPQGSPIVFFICHWKSKLGGDEATEGLRRASARIIARRTGELAQAEPGLPVIVMGDLNENHDEFYRRSAGAVCALMPNDPLAVLAAGAPPENGRWDFLVVSDEKPPAAGCFEDMEGQTTCPPVFYSPWGNELENGSYYYRNEWETIDHFLLSGAFFDGADWEFKDCRVLNEPPFAGSTGRPQTYQPRSGRGMSDHLPLLLSLKLIK